MIEQKLISKIEDLAKKYNVETDLLDLQAIWDSTLTDEENMKVIYDKIIILSSSKNQEDKIKADFLTKKKSIKNEREQEKEIFIGQYELQQEKEKLELVKLKSELESASKNIKIRTEITDLENSAEEKFMSSIKGYVNHEKYRNIKEYLKIITSSDSKINCLILEGEQGIGKSTIVKSILKELGKDIYYINSYTTSLAFYKTLYLNRYKHIILDDVFGIFNDEKGTAILRAITNTENIRYVKYESTSDKLDVPSNFFFEGSITILTNDLTNEMNYSLLNRAIHRRIIFTLEEKFNLMSKIAEFNYPDIELGEVIQFVRENVDDTTKNFTFRSVLKIIEFFIHNKESWKEMALEELEKDEELVYVKSIMNLSTETRNSLWIEKTGKSVRTLQRRIKELEERK